MKHFCFRKLSHIGIRFNFYFVIRPKFVHPVKTTIMASVQDVGAPREKLQALEKIEQDIAAALSSAGNDFAN